MEAHDTTPARIDDAPMLHEVAGPLAELLRLMDRAEVDAETGEVTLPATPFDLLERIGELRVELGPAVEAVAGRIESREALAAAIDEAATRLAARAEALRARAERDREAIRKALVATNTRKVEGPLYTVSLRQGSERVEVTDLAAVPTEFRRPPVPPPRPEDWPADKAEIAKHLKCGDVVPGCRIVRGEPTLVLK